MLYECHNGKVPTTSENNAYAEGSTNVYSNKLSLTVFTINALNNKFCIFFSENGEHCQ
jgi:hypothetical protein